MTQAKAYDVIIVGGGSAGCAAARRLVDDGNLSVLLIEDGRRDRSPFIHIPATFFKALMSKDATVVKSEAESQLGGRSYAIPQGNVLGGGSSVNAMCYIRGQAEDYDHWESLGCEGWSYADVLPVFVRHENNQRLFDRFHGNAGPLTVSDHRFVHPMTQRFLESAKLAGFPSNTDFNGAEQIGIGCYQTTTQRGRRASAAKAFVKPVLGVSNFDLITEHRVRRVVLHDGVAKGVELVSKTGDVSVVDCAGEVILTAGALVSPQILLRSGIGDQAELDRVGINCVRNLPGVGANLQDHTSALYTVELNDALSLNREDQGFKALKHGTHYALTRAGLLSSNIIEAGGFLDVTGDGRADVQLNTQAIVPGPPGKKHYDVHGFGCGTYCLRPRSRGRIRLRNADPASPPLLESGVLSAADDVDIMRRGMREVERIFAEAPLKEITRARIYPPPGGDDDAALEQHIRETARTVFHPAGTCAMGTDGAAVVNPRLQVRGIRGLRVADASIMPRLLSGNTNAPTMMIGDRAAGFVIEDR